MTISCRLIGLLAAMLCAVSCASSNPAPPPANAASGNQAFDEMSRAYLEDIYQRQPTWATYLGIHKYNDRIEDYSRKAVDDAVVSARSFRERIAKIDAASLSPEKQLDHEQLLRAIDSRLLTLEVLRPWAVDPDSYSSGLTRTAYIMIKRSFAPPEERLRQLIAREKAMPAALAEAQDESPEPAAHLHRDRHRADGRQSRLFRNGRGVGVSNCHRQGTARRVQAGQRRGHRGDGRLQEVAPERSAAAIDRELCHRRRDVPAESWPPTR